MQTILLKTKQHSVFYLNQMGKNTTTTLKIIDVAENLK